MIHGQDSKRRYLLWGSDGSEAGRGCLQDSSNKRGDGAVLECTDGTSAHGRLGGEIIVVLLDETHVLFLRFGGGERGERREDGENVEMGSGEKKR